MSASSRAVNVICEQKEIIKKLSEDKTNLIGQISYWSRQSGRSGNRIGQLKNYNEKLLAEISELHEKLKDVNTPNTMEVAKKNQELKAENEKLKSIVENELSQMHEKLKGLKHVTGSLDMMTRKNKELKEENAKIKAILKIRDQKVFQLDCNEDRDDYADIEEKLREKDELINFYKEICDAKVQEIEELKFIHMNRNYK